MKHIDHALVAKAHTPEYLMHKYWARKPHNVVAEYIKHYSKEGEIILDPFAGSGVTAIEAIKLGRKAIATDLAPVATFITRNTVIPVKLEAVEGAFKKIEESCKEKIGELYATKCSKCKKGATLLAAIWTRETDSIAELRYYCVRCGSKYAKHPDTDDTNLVKHISKRVLSHWYPTVKLSYNHIEFKEGTHDSKFNSVDCLFTTRNLFALSIIYEAISKIQDARVKDLMKFAFTSMSHLASRMCPVAEPGGKGHWSKYSATSFWAQHRYWIPPKFMESNVWMLFDSAVNGRQGILKGKGFSNDAIIYYKEAKTFDDLGKDANIFIKTHNAFEIEDILPPNSVDYVFTDPPYGGAIQYLELSTLWASWLGMNLNFKDEITINDSQKKDFDYYHKMLTASFKQVYCVLKPKKYMTVTFHSTDIRVWNSIIQAVILAGFELEKIIYQPPARASAKGLLQPYGSAVGDYYIRFKKPSTPISTFTSTDEAKYERIVVESTKKIIANRGGPCPYTYILNGIVPALREAGALLSGSKSIEKILKEHVGKEFEIKDVLDETGKVIGKKWWLHNPDELRLDVVPLVDRVEAAVVDILNRKVKVSFDDVLQEIFIKFPNSLTPETQDVQNVLAEYADKSRGGNWMLKPVVKDRASQHSKIIFMLCEIGSKLGFELWVGLKEQNALYKGKRLSEFIEILPIDVRNMSKAQISRIENIDLLWHKKGKIEFAFEVENTTSITEALVRGANIPYQVKMFIVIPEERATLLDRKLREPGLEEMLKKNPWERIYYSSIEDFYNTVKTKKFIEMKNFECLMGKKANIDNSGQRFLFI